MPENEKHTAALTVMLTPTSKEELARAARERGIPTSTLLRIIANEWLAAGKK